MTAWIDPKCLKPGLFTYDTVNAIRCHHFLACGGLGSALPALRDLSMGRAGLEPATLGLKVPCSTS
jgi:hypothetical protein